MDKACEEYFLANDSSIRGTLSSACSKQKGDMIQRERGNRSNMRTLKIKLGNTKSLTSKVI